MTALLVGLGNPDRGDDGVGVAVARQAAALGVRGLEVIQVVDPASLVHVWPELDDVVVVDAMASGSPPGTVLTIDVTTTPLPQHHWAGAGTHALGLAEVIELSRALDRLPAHLVVVGVEADRLEGGSGLSAPVAAAVDEATEAALSAVRHAAA